MFARDLRVKGASSVLGAKVVRVADRGHIAAEPTTPPNEKLTTAYQPLRDPARSGLLSLNLHPHLAVVGHFIRPAPVARHVVVGVATGM